MDLIRQGGPHPHAGADSNEQKGRKRGKDGTCARVCVRTTVCVCVCLATFFRE